MQIHDLYIAYFFNRPRDLTVEEIREMRAADRELAIASAPSGPTMQRTYGRPRSGRPSFSPQKEKVLWCVQAGAQDAVEIAALTGLPSKHVSAWLSVLTAQQRIIKISSVQLNKVGAKTHIYRAA